MRQIFPALLAALSALTCSAASARDFSVALGSADSHDGESAAVLDLSLRWPTSGRIALIDEHEMLAGYIESRPLPELDRGVAYAGYGFRSNFGRWYTGFAVVVVDHRTEALSSWYQFASTGGVHLGRAHLTLRHISNSGFEGRNRGETFVSLGFDW